MARKVQGTPVKMHPTNKAVIDTFAAEYRAEHGEGVTGDVALWLLLQKAVPHITQRFVDKGSPIPRDYRKKQSDDADDAPS